MGLRGRGAQKKPKEPKPKGKAGRPRIKIDPATALLLKPLVPKAIDALAKLMDSEDERISYLASKAILEHGSRPPREEPPVEAPKPKKDDDSIRVTWSNDFRAPTG